MKKGQNGVPVKHPRSGVAHHQLDFSPHCRLIAVDGAFCAGGFFGAEGTMVETANCVGLQVCALFAQPPRSVVMRSAVNIEHRLECAFFAGKRAVRRATDGVGFVGHGKMRGGDWVVLLDYRPRRGICG